MNGGVLIDIHTNDAWKIGRVSDILKEYMPDYNIVQKQKEKCILVEGCRVEDADFAMDKLTNQWNKKHRHDSEGAPQYFCREYIISDKAIIENEIRTEYNKMINKLKTNILGIEKKMISEKNRYEKKINKLNEKIATKAKSTVSLKKFTKLKNRYETELDLLKQYETLFKEERKKAEMFGAQVTSLQIDLREEKMMTDHLDTELERTYSNLEKLRKGLIIDNDKPIYKILFDHLKDLVSK